ncbi:gtpase [Malassezia pachydermatis]|uniref:Gtpase n=1 Tax=Malassezia pachydermatis TaxID=77020 RepID=A0A0M9VQ81_9BASI|nr:gtpase [Malassezia pachydermatis]KOS15202.1 gtpase [Malassezia pachydermatis]
MGIRPYSKVEALSQKKAQDMRNRKARHFVDTLLVQVQAGHGGDGCVSFHREKFVQMGPAAGGNGGMGGSVYIRSDPTIHSLARVHKRVVAKNGTPGEGDWLHGKRGNDVTIHVPVGTTAGWSMDFVQPTPPAEKGVLLARGGEGGLGNPHFLLERYHAPKIATKGMPGESLLLSLEYKQPADIGLVGLPNAGKSTLLRCLSRADAEVGAYSFTTLHPNLGVMQLGQNGTMLEDHQDPETSRMTIADLPGLIHDASKNRGLGHDFLRHIERCNTIVYVVDFGPLNPRPSSDIVILNRELEAYSPGLSERVALVVANKADLLGHGPDAPTAEEAHQKLARLRGDVQLIFEPRHVPVVPISALHRLNLDTLAKYLQIAKTASGSSANAS